MIVPALCRQTTGVRPRECAAGFYFYDGAGFGDKALFKKKWGLTFASSPERL